MTCAARVTLPEERCPHNSTMRPRASPPTPRAWSSSAKPVEIAVTGKLVRDHFGGTGFHAEMFLDTATKEYFDQVLAKRWRELNPSFARIMLKRQRSP